MASVEPLSVQSEDCIVTITLQGTHHKNELSAACLEALRTSIQNLYDDPNAQGAIITGNGSSFFATPPPASEIKELNELNARKFSEHGQEILALIENCHKPIVAAINGDAISGGLELALACHLRLAVAHAKLQFMDVAWGMIPGFGGTQRLTHIVGKTRALEMMMTGRALNAQEGMASGILNYLAEDQTLLMQKSKALLQKIIGHGPLAVGMLVNCVNAAHNPHEDGYQTEANSFANCCKKNGFRDEIGALLDQRTSGEGIE